MQFHNVSGYIDQAGVRSHWPAVTQSTRARHSGDEYSTVIFCVRNSQPDAGEMGSPSILRCENLQYSQVISGHKME